MDVAEVQPIPSDDNEQVIRPRLSSDHDIEWWRKIGYGAGHFYNDLCDSMWFTYLMIYLEQVLKLRSSWAGLLMLIGQVTDAVSTPLIGIASDSSILPKIFDKIGRRMSWHIIGTIFVTISFPFIFNRCLFCSDNQPEWLKVLWFVPFVVVFKFGWASVQTSHLALIPELSSLDSSRTTMSSRRHSFTVIANFSVFFILAQFLSESTHQSQIGPADFQHFRTTGFLVVAGGLAVTMLFYLLVREPKFGRRISRTHFFSSDASELVRMHWTSWFGHIHFYQTALLYILSRLYVNISQVYFPFYITLTQNYGKEYVALFPMVSYFSSFWVSVFTIPCFKSIVVRKFLLPLGLACGLHTCGWMLFDLSLYQMYYVATLIGVTQAILSITSLSITADLINKNTESGAFVYGAMSFVDKLANGLSYQIIELWNPCDSPTQPNQACTSFYRIIMVYVLGGCLVLVIMVLLSLIPSRIRQLLRRGRSDDRVAISEDENVTAEEHQ
ncbi:unnamed protein product [Cylicocyclus nassatus]|uniref:Major facilitator superfamily domain-containing protein 12-like n=1 Tax=Cylicocyclus nassatus TaxID=53992 RepID=A0AA36MDC3_CYLNA|nr:unnamed protein product [Cylicocyclus nassatus]